jgi:MoaA/NifB/PqqE/SkfB family radical SAM enzyme
MQHWYQVVRFGAAATVSALLRRRMLNCLWELTYRCNAKCAICAYWKHPSRPADEMSLPQIREGLENVYAYGCRLINFTGGEPTLRADLEEIVNAASRLGIWTSMVTNGSLLTRERIRGLREAGLDQLLISVDSTDPAIHDGHRRIPGCHRNAMACLRYLREEFLRGHRTGGMMCAISSRNAHQVLSLAALAAEAGVWMTLQPYHENKTGDAALSATLGAEVCDELLRRKRWNGALLNSRTYLEGVARIYRGGAPGPCSAGRKYFSVDPFGYIHPCVDMPAGGHVLRSDFSVLRSPEAQAAVSKCRGCWYCFRGEADSAMSAEGYRDRLKLAAGVIARNCARRWDAAPPPRPAFVSCAELGAGLDR